MTTGFNIQNYGLADQLKLVHEVVVSTSPQYTDIKITRQLYRVWGLVETPDYPKIMFGSFPVSTNALARAARVRGQLFTKYQRIPYGDVAAIIRTYRATAYLKRMNNGLGIGIANELKGTVSLITTFTNHVDTKIYMALLWKALKIARKAKEFRVPLNRVWTNEGGAGNVSRSLEVCRTDRVNRSLYKYEQSLQEVMPRYFSRVTREATSTTHTEPPATPTVNMERFARMQEED